MLMLVAIIGDGTLMMGCLGLRGGGGGGYLEELPEDDTKEEGLDDLAGVEEDTWVIFALSPWLLASSLRVSMMETVWT